ncbi:MAG: dienelactone hydrolase family protein [Planctomycetes bacterium]|nr:dienelactone hydrolase family protein [Planctomycetota bacterium]
MRPLLLALLLPSLAGAAPDLKKVEEFGTRWWKARPPNKFKDWDPAVREALLAEARAMGPIAEGSLEQVRSALWKSVRKHGPRGKGTGKMHIEDHGYKSAYTKDEMWATVKGGGKGEGLVVGIHGGGEGAGSADTGWTLKGCMGIYPQGLLLHGDNWNTVHGEKQILTLIEIAKAQWDIDPDRVYVMGFSMGGTGSWHMAGRFPDLLAGAVPGNGVIMASPKSQVATREEVVALQHGLLPNARNLAVYFFTGTADKNCMPGTFLVAWDEIQQLQKDDPGGYGKIRFKCYEGLAHSFPPGEPGNAFKYMSEQRRDSYPEKIRWEYAAHPHPLPNEKDTTTRYQQHCFYWIRVDEPVDRMDIVAVRKGNEFDVQLTGVEPKGCYVMLNPAMIDVKADVVVRVDGKEVYRGRPQPDLVTVVESLDDKLDKTLTFDRKVPLWKE